LELLVRLGGLSTADALTAATPNGAAAIGATEDRGTVEIGSLGGHPAGRETGGSLP